MIMVPRGTSMARSDLSVPVASIAAMTTPEPAAIAQKHKGTAPLMPCSRRAAVKAAAAIIASRMSAPTASAPCSSAATTMPTATICTSPRAIESAASRSTWTENQPHKATTAAHRTMAPAAWARPSITSPLTALRRSAGIEHLLGRPDRDQPPGFHDHRARGDALGLRLVVGDDHAGHRPLADDVADQLLNAARRGLVERRRGLVEQQRRGRVRQGARERHALRLAAREAAHVARRGAREADAREQRIDLFRRHVLAALARAEGDVGRHRAG